MANVFISYSKLDNAQALMIAQTIEGAGHHVWRDDRLMPADKWDQEIERRLREADAVVVLWSPHSARSEWVRIEADFARETGKLIPAIIEPCDIPLAFRFNHAVSLIGWDWKDDDPEIQKVLRAIQEVTAPITRNPVEPPPGYNIIQECKSTEWHVSKNTIVRVFDYRGSLSPIRLGVEFVFERGTLVTELTGLPSMPIRMLFMFTSEDFDKSKPLHAVLTTESGDVWSDDVPIRAHLRSDGHTQIGFLSREGADTVFAWLIKPQDIVLSLRNKDEAVLNLPLPYIPGLEAKATKLWSSV